MMQDENTSAAPVEGRRAVKYQTLPQR